MDSNMLLVVISMLYFIDASNALTCYNCTDLTSSGCGETLTNPSSIQLATCSGVCMVSKSTMSISGGRTLNFFSRTCEVGCAAGCYNFEGISICSNCCNTDLCNNAFTDPSIGGGNEENPPSPVGDTGSPQGGGGGDSNVFMCYNCTDYTNPGCGETLSDPSTTPQTACSVSCMVAKTSVVIGENTLTSFTRTCETFCLPGCQVIEGTTVCITCCSTGLCNSGFTDPSTGGDGGVSNPSVCYECDQYLNPGCGETLGDPSTIPQTVCTPEKQCMVSKASIAVSGNQIASFTRGCAALCVPGCINVDEDGSTMCSKCCNTDLCNSALTEGGVTPTEGDGGITAGGNAGITAGGNAGSPDSGTVTPQYGNGGSPPTDDTSKTPGGDASKPPGGDGENDVPAGNKGNPVANDGIKYATPTPSSAINLVANFATILITCLLCTTML